MRAEVAYQVAKELSKQELERLFSMLQIDISKLDSYSYTKNIQEPKITNKEAVSYLLKNVFDKRD